jgi:hypothetical protein
MNLITTCVCVVFLQRSTFNERRQRTDSNRTLSDEELINKFRLMLHFMGSGNASAKEYEELNDVSCCRFRVLYRAVSSSLSLADSRDQQQERELLLRNAGTEMLRDSGAVRMEGFAVAM